MNNNFDPDYPQVKRTYTPEEAGHEKRRRPVSRYSVKRIKKKKPNPGVLLLVLVFAAIFAVTIYLIASGKSRTELPADTTDYFSDSVTDQTVTTDDGLPYTVITVPSEQMYYGDLILVNSQNEYFFPEAAEQNIVDIKSAKNEYYGLSSYSTGLSKNVIEQFNTLCTDYYNYSGFKWMQVNSAYRSKQEQIDLYAEYTELYGADYAKAYVATPGFSEHHTGLALDLNVNVDGSIYYVESYEGCDWFRENAKNYGFILRYPDDKVHMTGISYESWHYRYVGTPHSQIMSDMNFCLEEYINYLKNYTYDTVCLGYDAATGVRDIPGGEEYDGGVMIYYVPCEGEETKVKVPKNSEYTVSGNNVDGFVVTVK
ncbi:MAG: M15 family metallopeptidase [Clostridia bacterium]|nr:M15 family metallopeptidase [Clostridia bacterium]